MRMLVVITRLLLLFTVTKLTIYLRRLMEGRDPRHTNPHHKQRLILR